MQRYVVQRGQTWDTGLVLQETPMPVAAEHDVLVRVHAVSLNYRDLGRVNAERDTVPLSDGAGEVVAVGTAVTDVSVGDRVAASFFPRWHDGRFDVHYHQCALGGSADGMLAQYVKLPRQAWIPIPDHLSYAEAATLPCAGLTAWHAIAEVNPVAPGDTVLLIGTGGVSIFALQFAKMAGARTIVVTSREQKHAKALALGADHVINSTSTPDWEAAVLSLTAGLGADQVVEVGGAGTLARSIAATRAGGYIKLIGVLTGFEGQINPLPLIIRSQSVNGIFVGSTAMFARMNRAISSQRMRPVIDASFGFNQLRDAYDALRSGRQFGKLVATLQ